MLCVVSTIVLAGCATPPASEPPFLDRYVGTNGSATLELDLLRELPRTPETGWLNVADETVAIGRFHAVRRRPIRFELTPHYVAFQSDRVDEHPSAKYYWRGDTLFICVLNMTPGTMKGSDKLALRVDYETCAPMERESK